MNNSALGIIQLTVLGEAQKATTSSVKSIKQNADVAQLAEQLTCNQQVTGSSPVVGLGENPCKYNVYTGFYFIK